jgi:hypothetical protein
VVERSTRFTVLVQLDGRDMVTVAQRLSVQMAQLPELVRRTLTWDRGMELAGHKEVTAATGLAVYLADPRSPGSGAPTRTPTGCFVSTSQGHLDGWPHPRRPEPDRGQAQHPTPQDPRVPDPADRLAALLH